MFIIVRKQWKFALVKLFYIESLVALTNGTNGSFEHMSINTIADILPLPLKHSAKMLKWSSVSMQNFMIYMLSRVL